MTAVACVCGGIKRDGQCDRCGEKLRRTTTEKGYDGAWKRFRARLKRDADFALCRDCLANGLVRPTEEFHHIKKIRERPDLRLDESNIMPLCKACHDVRSARGE